MIVPLGDFLTHFRDISDIPTYYMVTYASHYLSRRDPRDYACTPHPRRMETFTHLDKTTVNTCQYHASMCHYLSINHASMCQCKVNTGQYTKSPLGCQDCPQIWSNLLKIGQIWDFLKISFSTDLRKSKICTI